MPFSYSRGTEITRNNFVKDTTGYRSGKTYVYFGRSPPEKCKPCVNLEVDICHQVECRFAVSKLKRVERAALSMKPNPKR